MRERISYGVVLMGILWALWPTLSWIIFFPSLTSAEALRSYWWCYLLALACLIVGCSGMNPDS